MPRKTVVDFRQYVERLTATKPEPAATDGEHKDILQILADAIAWAAEVTAEEHDLELSVKNQTVNMIETSR